MKKTSTTCSSCGNIFYYDDSLFSKKPESGDGFFDGYICSNCANDRRERKRHEDRIEFERERQRRQEYDDMELDKNTYQRHDTYNEENTRKQKYTYQEPESFLGRTFENLFSLLIFAWPVTVILILLLLSSWNRDKGFAYLIIGIFVFALIGSGIYTKFKEK